MSYDVKKLKTDCVHRPCFCIFDILLYNDKVLTNEPLKKRLQILDDLIIDIDGVFMKSKRRDVNSK